MFKKKPGPELFELIKRGKLRIKKTPSPEESPPPEPTSPQPVPGVPQPRTAGYRPYPKWRIPFSKPTGTTPGERTFSLKYNAVILIIILGLLFVILAFVLGHKLGGKSTREHVRLEGSVSEGEQGPVSTPIPPAEAVPVPPETAISPPSVPSTIPSPRPPILQRTWCIRLIYYDDDTAGRASATNMLRWLRRKGVTGTFIKRQRIRGSMRLSVCVGDFSSQREASRSLDRYRRLHTAFRHCDVVER